MTGLEGLLTIGLMFVFGATAGWFAGAISGERNGRVLGRRECNAEWHGFAVVNRWGEWEVDPPTGRTFFQWKRGVIQGVAGEVEPAEEEGT